ncbi:MAG: adenylyl-sulfate kinase [Planctomycetota bacterium]
MDEGSDSVSFDDGGSDSKDIRQDIVWHEQTVSRSDRESRLGQRGCVVWFTGLSGCGKSTVANAVDLLLSRSGRATVLLDGDNVRHGLCAPPSKLAEDHSAEFADRFGLGFGAIDREENIRRIGSVAALMAGAGLITLTAFVSPYRADRDRVRSMVEAAGNAGDFVEVFVDTPLEICETRDPKGLYAKARTGQIKNFTGISDPYETPLHPEIRLDGSVGTSVEQLAREVLTFLSDRGFAESASEC